MSEFATLTLDGKEFQLPVRNGTLGEKAIDISKLRAETGYTTLDPSLGSTSGCESAITFIDGEKGILRYRGYDIEELAEQSRFVEVAFLLVYGHLPTTEELSAFSKQLNSSSLIHENMRRFFDSIPLHSHPMAILSTMVASLSAFYPLPDMMDEGIQNQVFATLISQVRTIAAFSYKQSIGEPMVYPSHKRKYVENFLHMMFSSPVYEYEMDRDIERAIDIFLILHADHEQNCSSTAVRVVGSSLANLYATISAGVAALWGPRHGGANQDAINMLEHIQLSGKPLESFVERAKKDPTFRLPGFGHRVYKTTDPRAKILKHYCRKLLNKPGMDSPLFDIAQQLEEIALSDDYFLSRNLYPNVDFYSGLILKAAGIPNDMFPVLFAIGRTPGWIAQWREMTRSPGFRICRPRQLYVGEPLREFMPIDRR